MVRLTAALETATRTSDHMIKNVANQTTVYKHHMSFPIKSLSDLSMEISSVHLCPETGETPLFNFDIALPVQDGYVEKGIPSDHNLKKRTDLKKEFESVILNSKFHIDDMNLLESVFFSHLDNSKSDD